MKNSLEGLNSKLMKKEKEKRTSGHEHRAIEIFLSEHTKILKINEQSVGLWGQHYIIQRTDNESPRRRKGVWDTVVENSENLMKNANWNSWKSRSKQIR